MNNPLRLQTISVTGFKSLDNFSIEFQPNVTVLIGATTLPQKRYVISIDTILVFW
jgi:predicted ATP-binding protein involved in virulence